jgi:hypothetical protein
MQVADGMQQLPHVAFVSTLCGQQNTTTDHGEKLTTFAMLRNKKRLITFVEGTQHSQEVTRACVLTAEIREDSNLGQGVFLMWYLRSLARHISIFESTSGSGSPDIGYLTKISTQLVAFLPMVQCHSIGGHTLNDHRLFKARMISLVQDNFSMNGFTQDPHLTQRPWHS